MALQTIQCQMQRMCVTKKLFLYQIIMRKKKKKEKKTKKQITIITPPTPNHTPKISKANYQRNSAIRPSLPRPPPRNSRVTATRRASTQHLLAPVWSSEVVTLQSKAY